MSSLFYYCLTAFLLFIVRLDASWPPEQPPPYSMLDHSHQVRNKAQSAHLGDTAGPPPSYPSLEISVVNPGSQAPPPRELSTNDTSTTSASDYLIWSIVSAIFCYLPLGIFAIYCSLQIRRELRNGE